MYSFNVENEWKSDWRWYGASVVDERTLLLTKCCTARVTSMVFDANGGITDSAPRRVPYNKVAVPVGLVVWSWPIAPASSLRHSLALLMVRPSCILGCGVPPTQFRHNQLENQFSNRYHDIYLSWEKPSLHVIDAGHAIILAQLTTVCGRTL